MTWSNYRHRFQSPHRLVPARTEEPSTSLLSEGILDANVDRTEPNMIRVALWREWQGMLADLRNLGPVWSIVRNYQCVLAASGDYPELAFSSDHLAAHGREADTTLTCHFPAWRRAAAFESGCCCGRLYGVEITNEQEQAIHRICLARDDALDSFIEWTRMHQATGLEDEPEIVGHADEEHLHPQFFARHPGTLEVPADRLRTTLIHAAQREIPLIASVASEGATQTTRLDITQASESRGWLILSGPGRSLYVDAAPAGTLLVEPSSTDGEPNLRLSLVDPNDHRLLHLRGVADDRPAWNQLIREFVLCSTIS